LILCKCTQNSTFVTIQTRKSFSFTPALKKIYTIITTQNAYIRGEITYHFPESRRP
jgi:hypothetical protein